MLETLERNVNVLQEVLESTATHGGRIVAILGNTVRDIAREINDLIAEGIELAEAGFHEDEEQDLDESGEIVETGDVDDDVATVAEVTESEPTTAEVTEPETI